MGEEMSVFKIMEKEKLKKNPITVLDNRKSRNNRVFSSTILLFMDI